MNLEDISRLISAGRFDICHSRCTFDPHRMIYRSRANGKKVNLFKVLLSTDCRFDCKYCPNGWKKGFTSSPEDLAKLFSSLKRLGMANGAFISSAINGDPDTVMERILETGRLIRKFHRGYLHLKIVPGCSEDYIDEALSLANRVSINLETTSESRMKELSSVKELKIDIIRKQRKICSKIRKMGNKSHTTQIIAGLGESDEDILDIMQKEYESLGVTRVYISRFVPLNDTPFKGRMAEKRKRVVNLYRMDALLRLYGYTPKEIKSVMADGFLPSEDPKILIAEQRIKNGENIEYEKIPGCGKKISEMLKSGKTLLQIKKEGYSIRRMSAYVKNQKRLYDFVE